MVTLKDFREFTKDMPDDTTIEIVINQSNKEYPIHYNYASILEEDPWKKGKGIRLYAWLKDSQYVCEKKNNK